MSRTDRYKVRVPRNRIQQDLTVFPRQARNLLSHSSFLLKIDTAKSLAISFFEIARILAKLVLVWRCFTAQLFCVSKNYPMPISGRELQNAAQMLAIRLQFIPLPARILKQVCGHNGSNGLLKSARNTKQKERLKYLTWTVCTNRFNPQTSNLIHLPTAQLGKFVSVSTLSTYDRYR